MSFRLFVYYCAIAGGFAGFIGWVLGKVLNISVTGDPDYLKVVLHESLVGMFLGFAVAFGLSFLDAAFDLSLRQLGKVFLRVITGIVIGMLGGLFGSFVGGSLYYWTQATPVFIISWVIVGFLVGMSISTFQVLASLTTQTDVGSAFKKFIKCVVGGTIGGLIGGLFAILLNYVVGKFATSPDNLWSPTAIGFIVIGACIGLLVGLAQVILKDAWIKVEAGFRPGREMLISKAKTSIGRAEGSDIALFGDSGVEKAHAQILLEDGRYFLEDLQTPGGTYINEQKIQGKTPLNAGDLIRMGKSVLLFNERVKRKD
jgi:MFS family permease